MLFLLALCAFYRWVHYKKVLWLVTAFTIGHSLSLAWSVAGQLPFDRSMIETLIPITILLTALINIFQKRTEQADETAIEQQGAKNGKKWWLRYSIAGLFGLIHGLGFSSYLRALLGKEESFFGPLVGFNTGLEVGQLCIVLVFISINTLTFRITSRPYWWPYIVSGVAAGWSLFILF